MATETHDADSKMWTARLRNKFFGTYPPEKLLPDRQPAYVSSWIYVFGVVTIAGFVMLILTGLVLTLEGPAWYHHSGVGHYFNSVHFWSVQLFMFSMVVHLWGKFWMAAWRGHRAATWITGTLCFLIGIATAFTGYLMQTAFDSQWISFEAKDGLNAAGIGAWFNVTNLGQVMLIHVALLPVVLALIVVGHILMVRKHGVVPPLPNKNVPDAAATPKAETPQTETEKSEVSA